MPKKPSSSEKEELPIRRRIEIDKLRFDPHNPRIAERLGKSPSQDQMYNLLLGDSVAMSARELIPSFMVNGYLPYEPLIVRPAAKGRYAVLEGNRRLAALTAMRDSKDQEERSLFQKHGLRMVPCVIFAGSVEEELAYLALRHVSKTKDWTSAAKAAFIERMLKSGVDLDSAAQRANVTKNALRQMLLVRRLFERASRLGIEIPTSSTEGDLVFWHLGDAVRRTRTKQYLRLIENENPMDQPDLDESRFENLVGWLYGNPKRDQGRLIASIRDIPNLDKCLGHPKSIDALERGDKISDALEEAEAAGARVGSHLERARSSVQRATAALSDVGQEGIPDVKEARSALDRALRMFDVSIESVERRK